MSNYVLAITSHGKTIEYDIDVVQSYPSDQDNSIRVVIVGVRNPRIVHSSTFELELIDVDQQLVKSLFDSERVEIHDNQS
jgi:hypothetical protein